MLFLFVQVWRKTFSLRILPKMLTFISRFVICALFTCQARNRKNFEYGSLVMIREKIRNKSFPTLEKWQVQHISLPKKITLCLWVIPHLFEIDRHFISKVSKSYHFTICLTFYSVTLRLANYCMYLLGWLQLVFWVLGTPNWWFAF